MGFQQFRSPTLPDAPITYEQGYFSNLVGDIASFFGVIDSRAPMTLAFSNSDLLPFPNLLRDMCSLTSTL